MKLSVSKTLNILLALSLLILLIKLPGLNGSKPGAETSSTDTITSIPDFTSKISIDYKLISGAKPAMVIGSYSEEMVPNIMTASWYGVVNSNPPKVAVSMRPATLSYHNVTHSQAFTVNLPTEYFLKETDFAGQNSGRDIQKFDYLGLTPVKAEFVNAPYIDEFPLILECKVVEYHELGSHRQFIGQVMNVKASPKVLDENQKLVLDKLLPAFMGDDRYYHGLGPKLLEGYDSKLKKKK